MGGALMAQMGGAAMTKRAAVSFGNMLKKLLVFSIIHTDTQQLLEHFS